MGKDLSVPAVDYLQAVTHIIASVRSTDRRAALKALDDQLIEAGLMRKLDDASSSRKHQSKSEN